MGKAKRRKQQDPNYGESLIFCDYDKIIESKNLEGVFVSDAPNTGQGFLCSAVLKDKKCDIKCIAPPKLEIDSRYPRRVFVVTSDGNAYHIASAVEGKPVIRVLKVIIETSPIKSEDGVPLMPIIPVSEFTAMLRRYKEFL
jgi:hypothetical protein